MGRRSDSEGGLCYSHLYNCSDSSVFLTYSSLLLTKEEKWRYPVYALAIARVLLSHGLSDGWMFNLRVPVMNRWGSFTVVPEPFDFSQ